MISRDARLERRKDERLPVTADLEDGPAAIADIKIFVVVECDPGRYSHALRISGLIPIGRDFIDRSLIARGNVHLSLAIERNGSCIHQVGDKRPHRIIGPYLEDGYRNF